MPSKLDKSWLALSGDEEVVNWTHPSWYNFTKEVISGAAMALLGLYLVYVTHFGDLGLSSEYLQLAKYGSYLFILGGLAFIAITAIERSRMYYVVTTETVLKKTQIVNKNPDYIPVDRVQMARARQENFGLDEFLGYGHIILSTAATAGEEFSIKFVPQPYEFKRSIELARKGVSPEKIREIVDKDITLNDLDEDIEDLIPEEEETEDSKEV